MTEISNESVWKCVRKTHAHLPLFQFPTQVRSALLVPQLKMDLFLPYRSYFLSTFELELNPINRAIKRKIKHNYFS